MSWRGLEMAGLIPFGKVVVLGNGKDRERGDADGCPECCFQFTLVSRVLGSPIHKTHWLVVGKWVVSAVFADVHL